MNVFHPCVICALSAIPLIPSSRAESAAPAAARAGKPNIIFILADDVGLGEVSCTGVYWKGKYLLNGKNMPLTEGQYLPDLTHNFIMDFIKRHHEKPFFLYYPMIHIHIPIQPTPASKPGASADQLYIDNLDYMDKLVGKLVAELDRLKLREKTLIVFAGDNGSIRPSAYTPVNGKLIFGHKASMQEGGSRVPLIANWPGTTPAGTVNHDLTDFTDFFTTFAELGGASLPQGVTLDGHSIVRQIHGEKGQPRDWVYVELMGKSFVRDARWKLANDGGFFDLKDAPFNEIPVAKDTTDAAALAARKKLQAVLDDHQAAPWDGQVRPGKKPAVKDPATNKANKSNKTSRSNNNHHTAP